MTSNSEEHPLTESITELGSNSSEAEAGAFTQPQGQSRKPNSTSAGEGQGVEEQNGRWVTSWRRQVMEIQGMWASS